MPGDSDGGKTARDAGDASEPDASGSAATEPDAVDRLVEGVLAGEQRALARSITRIEDRGPGYRDLVGALHRGADGATVLGITGSPGSGKSTLVDRLARAYHDRGETVGVVAVDPSSPYSGGAVLGDRIRMADLEGVFVRSMGARGQLGGLAAATADAVTALDAFGADRVLVETVGAGQNEVDVVRTADTVAVLVPPGSGDDVQMLKAGVLEIGDVFVVNKADLDGADRTVAELRGMLERRSDGPPTGRSAVDGAAGAPGAAGGDDSTADAPAWEPRIVETVATWGEGVADVLDAVAAHRAHLDRTGERDRRARERYADTIRSLLREDAGRLLEGELDRRGGVEAAAERVAARETDPYTVVEEVLEPLGACVERAREHDDEGDACDEQPDAAGAGRENKR